MLAPLPGTWFWPRRSAAESGPCCAAGRTPCRRCCALMRGALQTPVCGERVHTSAASLWLALSARFCGGGKVLLRSWLGCKVREAGGRSALSWGRSARCWLAGWGVLGPLLWRWTVSSRGPQITLPLFSVYSGAGFFCIGCTYLAAYRQRVTIFACEDCCPRYKTRLVPRTVKSMEVEFEDGVSCVCDEPYRFL